jgi:hypothetical protein
MKSIAAYTLAAWTPALFAHEKSGWSTIHWHFSDFAGLATVGVLALAALWLSRRPRRGAKE